LEIFWKSVRNSDLNLVVPPLQSFFFFFCMFVERKQFFLEVASKSIRVTWEASIGEVSGYKVQMIPMMTGSKRQELYVGPGQTSVVVRDLSPDTEYQISLYALKGLTPSDPVMVMQKTQPVKVSVECSLGVDVQAEVVLLVDGSYSIGLANFAKVRAFLEVLVNSFDIGPNKVQISLVQYSRDPHTEFYLNTHHDLPAVVKAVRTFPYRGGSTNTGRAMTYVRDKIFLDVRGARPNVPRVTILITDGKSSDAFQDPATKLRNSDVEIFAVGVKDAVRSELEAIANTPVETHVYTVEDFDAFEKISKELTQSICLRIEQELRKRKLGSVQDLKVSEETTESFRVSWQPAPGAVTRYRLTYEPVGDERTRVETATVGAETTIVLLGLLPKTTYRVTVSPEYSSGSGVPQQIDGTTKEVRGSPRDLRVFDETTSSMKVSWEAAPGNVLQYRVAYRPSAGGTKKELSVKGDNTASVLKNLQPGTQYDIFLSARYQSGLGDALEGQGTTLEGNPVSVPLFWVPG
uniref:Collagen, type XII, alpha 1b n=1 Tax=Labrus bergylta TaxID=56723 RepID=A0A3Q3GJ81_9LABR